MMHSNVIIIYYNNRTSNHDNTSAREIIIIFIIMLLCTETVSIPCARVVCQSRMRRESHVSFARLADSYAKDCQGILVYRT